MSAWEKAEVLQLVFNDFKNDSRVEKTCESLARAGYPVTVFAFWSKGLPRQEERESCKVFRFGNENRFVSLFFLAKAVFLPPYYLGLVQVFH